MADDNEFYLQLPANANAKPTQNPESASEEDPPNLTTTTVREGEEEEEEVRSNNDDPDADTGRGSKRRKSCPSALDKCEAIFKSCCNSGLSSFSFDPKFCSGVTTPEVTPKFGSFNLAAAAAMTASAAEEEEEIKDKIEEKTKEVEVEEKDGETNQVMKKRKLVEISLDVD